MNKLKFLWLFMLVFLAGAQSPVLAENQLKFAVTIIRHGDRTPTDALPRDPHTWKIGLGELTPLGMNQQYELGKLMRKRYTRDNKLLEPSYVNGSIYARSTDFNRTVQSLECFLTGLYPLGTGPKLNNGDSALPAAAQCIPFRTLPLKQDDLLLAKDANIDTYNEMCRKYVYSQPGWKAKEEEYKNSFPDWSSKLGEKFTTLTQLMPVGDNLNVRKRNGVAMPPQLSEEDQKKIIYLGEWCQAQQIKPKVMGDFFGSALLNNIREKMNEAAAGKTECRYVLYSGHDTTLLPVLSALGVPLNINPPYASHIDFELYSDNGQYTVEVFFNNEPLVLTGSDPVCTLEEFNRIADEAVAGKKELEKTPIQLKPAA
jgi:lysosomal acid phosphatase